MTGKQMYDTLVWAWEQNMNARHRDRSYAHYQEDRRDDGFLKELPPAWPFLSKYERAAFSQAAKELTPESESPLDGGSAEA